MIKAPKFINDVKTSMNFYTIVPFIVLALVASLANANGRDGQQGAVGEAGQNGKNGKASINWVPRDPNPEWFFYFPIKNGDVEAFKKVLAGGAKVNWPMTNIIGRPTAFEVAMEAQWIEGLRIMFENPDPRNRPDIRDTFVRNRNNSPMSIYEFLIFSDSIDQHGNLEPNFAVRTNDLEILKMVLKANESFDDLDYSTKKIRVELVAESNKFRTFPNNVEALRAIESRLEKLKLKD